MTAVTLVAEWRLGGCPASLQMRNSTPDSFDRRLGDELLTSGRVVTGPSKDDLEGIQDGTMLFGTAWAR
ncbi:uncharacterized protein RMCC_0733 [Mycolicibacterium canariasense]|uniref:Uncharacterized protein n=1 Tax=Mycolicibacterium canariasense TaxID=228230 RepID=A0A117I8U7_MYCCR|nr:uncharacterized protein RMCC_0733 [Mycolicibacterium canariasense]